MRHPASLPCLRYEWHSDGDGPGVFSLLHCLATPAAGGATLFASMSAAYASLSADQRALADTFVGVHSNRHTAGGPAAVDAECGLRMDATGTRRIRAAERRKPAWKLGESWFPVVQTHPTRGRVLVGGGKNVDHFEVCEPGFSPEQVAADGGAEDPQQRQRRRARVLSEDESAALCSELLLAHLRPSQLSPLSPDDLLPTGETTFDPLAVLQLSWRPRDLVIWDNMALLHSTTPVALYGPGERRFLHVIATDARRAVAGAGGGGRASGAAAGYS